MRGLFDWVHEEGVRRLATGGEVPEGIFYPVRPELTDAEWKAEALAAGAALWRAIGKYDTWLVGTGTGTLHALRNQPRGYGKRRREWARTSECGLVFGRLPDRQRANVFPLERTTCLSCRKAVRERFENGLRCDTGWSDAGMDAYDAQHADDWWKIQAEWHKPDPIVLWNVPPNLSYSLIGG